MASRNDVTGDKIQTKGVFSKEAEDNFDLIFGKKTKDPLCNVCGKSLAGTKECAWTSCPLNWDEARIDVIGPNGNEGLHYNE